MPTKKPSCIVIGAGLSGLAAAWKLIQRGWKVDIVEAFPRVGGRVCTYRFEGYPDLYCELGGEWIGEHHTRMRALCRSFKLGKLLDHRYSFAFPGNRMKPTKFYRAGGWPFAKPLKKKLKKFLKDSKSEDECAQKELDRYDWWRQLQHLGFKEKDLLRRDLMDGTDFGESIRLTSAYVAAGEYSGSNDYDEMDSKIKRGNIRLPEALRKAIERSGRGKFHLGRRVRRIHQTSSDVSVTFDAHVQDSDPPRWKSHSFAPLSADFCICTVPAKALTAIRWTPKLPEDFAEAANQLQYCRIVKTVVLYANRFWDKSKFKPKGGGHSWFTLGVSDYCFHATHLQGKDSDPGILCSYAIGDKADDIASATENQLKGWITEDIEDASGLPRGTASPIDIECRPWQHNPFAQGAYAFYRSGQSFTVQKILSQPFMRTHFAGEHLDDTWQGFMEGAVRTGELAASQV